MLLEGSPKLPYNIWDAKRLLTSTETRKNFKDLAEPHCTVASSTCNLRTRTRKRSFWIDDILPSEAAADSTQSKGISNCVDFSCKQMTLLVGYKGGHA